MTVPVEQPVVRVMPVGRVRLPCARKCSGGLRSLLGLTDRLSFGVNGPTVTDFSAVAACWPLSIATASSMRSPPASPRGEYTQL